MGLKLYFDFMSQPSRALYILMKTANINFEPVSVALKKGKVYFKTSMLHYVIKRYYFKARISVKNFQSSVSSTKFQLLNIMVFFWQKGTYITNQSVEILIYNKLYDDLIYFSVAIAKYLAKEKLLAEKLFPIDSKTEAKVNEYLAWQHIGIRAPCALYFLGVVSFFTILEESPTYVIGILLKVCTFKR